MARAISWLIPSLVVAAASAVVAPAAADSPGSTSVAVAVGSPIWTRQFETSGQPASTETVGDVFRPTEQIAIQHQWTKLLQPVFAIQATEAATAPPANEPSRFTALLFEPGMSFTFGSTFVLGVDAIFAARSQGQAKFAFGLQGRPGVSVQLGSGWSFVGQLQVPVMFGSGASIMILPLVGVGHSLGG